MLDQDGSDSVGPWSILVFFSCTLAPVTTATRTTLHGMFVVICYGGHRGGDMVSDMVNPGDVFLEIKFFLISCYHVSRCLDT